MEMLNDIRDYHKLTGKMASYSMGVRARRGELMFLPPVGYLLDFTGPMPSAVLDPVLSPLVAESFRLYVTNRYSLRSLLAAMAERGLVTRSGKSMGTSALHAMLTNPFYTGKVRWAGELLDGPHEPVVDGETFERVQRLMERKRCNRS